MVIDLRESGRILEISYPWKCNLTEGEERWPKILPRLTLVQTRVRYHCGIRGGRPEEGREAPLAPGAAEQLQMAETRWAAGQPQRQVAADLGVARSTLQDWRRADPVGAAPAAPAISSQAARAYSQTLIGLMLGMLNSNWRCGKPRSRRDESSQRRRKQLIFTSCVIFRAGA